MVTFSPKIPPSLMSSFTNWITRQFLEWQAKEGKRKTIEEFATYLGISRPLLTMWMNGNKKPGKENIKILAETFGVEIFDVLGLERPNPIHFYVERNWDKAPEKVLKQIAEIISKYTTEPVPNGTKAK